MLWVDDDFVTVADLQSMDAEVPDVAQTEGISLEGDNGIIRRAKGLCQSTLTRYMSFRGLSPQDITLRNVNLPNVTYSALSYNYAGFAQLVVSGESESNWSLLKQWAVARTLRLFYTAATNKNADRYSDRVSAIEDDIRLMYWPNFKRQGLPILFNPLPAPGAIMERAGTFGSGNVTSVAGSGTEDADFEFAITWVGSKYTSASAKNNNESYRSARVTLTLATGQVGRVSTTGLTAPNGNQPEFTKASCRYSPGVAAGWNVWAGQPNGVMYRQNPTVLGLGTTQYTLTGNPVLSGEELDLGQFNDVILEINNDLERC